MRCPRCGFVFDLTTNIQVCFVVAREREIEGQTSKRPLFVPWRSQVRLTSRIHRPNVFGMESGPNRKYCVRVIIDGTGRSVAGHNKIGNSYHDPDMTTCLITGT